MENGRYPKSVRIRRGPRVTSIGGGTGMSTLLRGLKQFTRDITAIVTVADDGGGSGVLRNELGMPPPGDIRNCIQALSNAEPIIEKLLGYRFGSGSLKGQSFGNLFLAAINGMSDSFDKAVVQMGEVLSITGRVLPVTNEDVRLLARFEDGGEIIGESQIAAAKTQRRCRIKCIELLPARVPALDASIEAIKAAELIVLGPGSLYTSIIPNLLVEGVAEAVAESNAVKVYVCNVMTQPGETEGYTVSDHIRALIKHGGNSNGKLFDYCLVNNAPAPPEVLARYIEDGAVQVDADEEAVRALGVELIRKPIGACYSDFARHDSEKLAREVIRVFTEKSPTRLY